MPGLRLDIATEGLDLLSEAFQNAPAAVARCAAVAGQQAIPVIVRSIQAFTPVRTGFLKSSASAALEGPFNLIFTAAAPYASYVDGGTWKMAARDFTGQGIDAATPELERIYDDAFSTLVDDFGN